VRNISSHVLNLASRPVFPESAVPSTGQARLKIRFVGRLAAEMSSAAPPPSRLSMGFVSACARPLRSSVLFSGRRLLCERTRGRYARRPLGSAFRYPKCALASYAEMLATKTSNVAHLETDALIADVRLSLDSGKDVPECQIQEMVVHLGDSRGMARLGLVDSFGLIGSDAVSNLLLGLKNCPNPVVRRSCGKALAKIGDPSATDALLETLVNDDDTVTRSSAAGALAKMGISAIPKLLAVISSPDFSMTAKGHAAWAIAFMQGAASEALFGRAEDSNADVRLAVISALGAVAIGDALPSMGSGFGADDWVESAGNSSDAAETVVSVEASQRDRAIALTSRALDDECPQVRAEAATALANASVVSEAPRIAKLLFERDVELRRTAALALMKLGHMESGPTLEAFANDETEPESFRNVARFAANALSRAREAEGDER
jgi:bilin biosynthesis protein